MSIDSELYEKIGKLTHADFSEVLKRGAFFGVDWARPGPGPTTVTWRYVPAKELVIDGDFRVIKDEAG